MTETPKCDVCGAPATHWARDVWRHEVPGQAWAQFFPVRGRSKSGCDAHPVESVEHWTELAPDGARTP